MSWKSNMLSIICFTFKWTPGNFDIMSEWNRRSINYPLRDNFVAVSECIAQHGTVLIIPNALDCIVTWLLVNKSEYKNMAYVTHVGLNNKTPTYHYAPTLTLRNIHSFTYPCTYNIGFMYSRTWDIRCLCLFMALSCSNRHSQHWQYAVSEERTYLYYR